MRSIDKHLCFLGGGAASGLPLPPWAGLMAKLGYLLAEVDPAEHRIVVGVTVPARGYAAALSAASYVLRRDHLDSAESCDADRHFDELRSLPKGTPVKFIRGGRLRDARAMGVEERDGNELLKILTRGTTEYLPKQVALKVQIVEEARTGSGDLRSRRIDVPPLLNEMVGPSQSATYVTHTRSDCAIVGTLTKTSADLSAVEFGACSDMRTIGCLQDFARAEGVAGAASGSRSVLVAAGSDEENLPEETQSLAIFDGGRGYVRLGHRWARSHHLVIIDRSHPAADQAAEVFNQAYFGRKSLDGICVDECPTSVELVSFEAESP